MGAAHRARHLPPHSMSGVTLLLKGVSACEIASLFMKDSTLREKFLRPYEQEYRCPKGQMQMATVGAS